MFYKPMKPETGHIGLITGGQTSAIGNFAAWCV